MGWCACWLLIADSYEHFLGSLAWDLFPQKDVLLNLKDHVFTIALRSVSDTVVPQLTLVSHNFGFGFVITGAVIMGTKGKSWALRVTGLSCAWLVLLTTQTVLLVAAAHTYRMAITQSELPLAFSVFIKSVHPTVTILPVVIIVLWLVAPFEKFMSGLMDSTQGRKYRGRNRR